MCDRCDYETLLNDSGLKPSANRVRILSEIGTSRRPLTATEILENIKKGGSIDRVTVYRNLDLLVSSGLLQKLSSPDGRSFFYGFQPSTLHPAHPHFFCRMCGRAECLSPSVLPEESEKRIASLVPGITETIQVSIAGVCTECLKVEKAL